MRRRAFLATGAGITAGVALPVRAAQGLPEAIRGLVGDRLVQAGKVSVDLPPLVENGNVVPLTVSVESAMTAADRVRAIHVFAPKNPQPLVAVFRFGPRAGRAAVSTRIRLADSQTVTAVCEMADGSFRSGSADAVVTVAACTEGL